MTSDFQEVAPGGPQGDKAMPNGHVAVTWDEAWQTALPSHSTESLTQESHVGKQISHLTYSSQRWQKEEQCAGEKATQREVFFCSELHA